MTDLCTSLAILKILYMLKLVFTALSIIVPLTLIILVMVDVFKIVLDGEFKSFSIILKRFVAAIVIFMVPTVVFALFDILMPSANVYNNSCWSNATRDNIKELELARFIREQEEDLDEEEPTTPTVPPESWTDPGGQHSGDIPESKSLMPFVNGVQRPLNPGDCMSKSDNCACPSKGRFNGFYFTMASDTGRDMASVTDTGETKMITVKVTCSDGLAISKTINSKVKDNYEKAFNRICLLRTTGINGVKISDDNLLLDGTLVRRTTSNRRVCSFHAYGSAIDINYNLTITVNGQKYTPYRSQGTDTRQEYDRFVAAIGKENDVRNVNYILWKFAFEPYNFTWGGNWSDASFDPMHFEISK